MAATLQARYSTTQRLSGCCSGQVRPVVGMVLVMSVVVIVVRPVAVVMLVMVVSVVVMLVVSVVMLVVMLVLVMLVLVVSMVCPPGDRRPHCRPAVVSRGSSAYLLLSCPSSADILSYQQ